jgi:predicted DCC family thiol-disulfide oxidoreductase YuxK
MLQQPLVVASLIAVAIWCRVNAFSPSTPPQHGAAPQTRLSAEAASVAVLPPTYAFSLFGLAAKKSKQQNSPMLFDVPSIFHPSDNRPVVLFDGKCNLCNAGVQLILDTDRATSDPRGNLRVAALQSRVGKILLARLPEDQRAKVLNVSNDEGKEYKSIVVTSANKTWLNSAACIRIGKELKGPLRFLALLASIIPSFLRDPLYKLLSRHRKKLFGEAPECRLWDDNWDTRFVDDAMFGGRGASDVDPFVDPNAEDIEEEDVDIEEAPVGSSPLIEGNLVRVVSPIPILHSHVAGYEERKLCSVGMVGTVTRVLERRAYPRNVAVRFELESDDDGASTTFEAHFFPGQLQKK